MFNKLINTNAGGGGGTTPDLSTATFVASRNLGNGGKGGIRNFFVTFDGTRIFTTHLDSSNNDWINQHNLSTPFDVTSVSGIVGSKQLSASIPDYLDALAVNLDNTWVTYDPYAINNYYSQPFGTAGEITTIGTLYTSSCGRTGADRVSHSQMISKDGNYSLSISSQLVYRKITLGTNNNLSTASGCGVSTSVSGITSDLGAYAMGFNFNLDGTKFYVFGGNGNSGTYDLSTPWDVSTRSNLVTNDFSADLGNTELVFHIQFNSDYSKMIICTANDSYATYKIHGFDLG